MQQDRLDKLSNWVREFTSDLLRWAITKTGDQALAEDLVQDTFLAAAEQLDRFREDSHPRTWLFSILRNKIADHYRKHFRDQDRLEEALHADVFFHQSGAWNGDAEPKTWPEEDIPLLDQSDFIRVLQRCLDLLNPIMHNCIRMRFLEEQKGEIICQELNIAPTNYWQLMHRAKLYLRNCLERNWFNDQSI